MGMALQEQASPTSFIEYNGYMFGTRTKSRIQIVPQKDSSGRTEIMRRYILNVSTIVVPRRNIPGDGKALNIQVEKPGAKVDIPGLTPNHIASTVDAEIHLIIEKLTETGKTLRYIGQGVGDIVVNTLHPKTGQFIQDLNYGPHCKITSLHPIGFNKSYKLEWECEFSLYPGKLEDFSLNDIHKRILEYNYGVEYKYDSSGYCTRSIQGHLRIVPPMFRGLGSLTPTGSHRSLEATNFENLTNSTTQARNALKFGGLTGLVRGREKLTSEYYKLTSLIKGYQDFCLLMPFEAALTSTYIKQSLDRLQSSWFEEDRAKAKDKFYEILALLENAYTENGRNLSETPYKEKIRDGDNEIEAYFFLRNYIITGMLRKVPELRKYPEIANMFPTGSSPLNNKVCYGPFAFDNIGNLQNYETVDQYKELIWNSIVLPHGFKREGFSWTIDQNKSLLKFSIIDRECPSFSFIPGYAEVKGHQDTSSTGSKFLKFNTNISATFKLGKYINITSSEDLKGYSDSYRTMNEENNIKDYVKKTPSKRQAYADFVKLVFQRLALPLFLHNQGFYVELIGPDKKMIQVGSNINCIPHTFQCREDLFSDTISYTIGYTLTTQIDNFFITTGHGLPAIIASDLSTTQEVENFIEARTITDIGGSLIRRRRYVASVLFSKYTDAVVHRDWILSQRFSSMSPRGGSNIFFDRSYDRPINISILNENYSRTIPLHGEYPNLYANRSLNKIEFINQKIDNGDLANSVVIEAEPVKITEEGRHIPYTYNKLYSYKAASSTSVIVHIFRARNTSDPVGTREEVVETKVFNTAKIFNEHREKQDENINSNSPGLYTKYKLYTAEEFLKNNKDAVILENSLGNTDVDLFLRDLAGGDDETNEIISKSSLIVPEISFQEGFNQDVGGSEYDSVEDFVAQGVGDFITKPSPLNSWLSYRCELKIDTDNKIIRHKTLPRSEVIADFGKQEISNDVILNELIRTNQDAIFNTGPNSLKGGSPDSDLTVAYPQNTDVIQILNEPSHVIILSGSAARLNYEVVAPTLLRYGGCSVIQKRRLFSKEAAGEPGNITHYGAWYIEYYVVGNPSGFLGTPKTPWQIENPTVPLDDETTEDILSLPEQSNLLDLASELIGFAVESPSQ